MNLTRRWFGGLVVFGFACIISFFQINSAWADEHNFNGVFGWLGLGILFGLFKVAKYGGGSQE